MMRHVSKTLRVALDGMFDRCILDPQGQNQICRHQKANLRTCKPKIVSRVVPSGSIAEHHEFLDVFPQPLSFEQKAEHHVSGKKDRRRACGSETEVGTLGFKKLASSLDSGALLVPEIKSWAQGHLCETVQNPATSSQEWQKDDSCLRSTRTLVQSGVCERSGSIGKLVRGVENQLARTRLDFHMRDRKQTISWESLRESSTAIESLGECWCTQWEDQSIDPGTVSANNDESISSSWAQLQWKFGCVQEHQLQGVQDVVRHYAKVDLGTCVRDSECLYDSVAFHLLYEIYFVTW